MTKGKEIELNVQQDYALDKPSNKDYTFEEYVSFINKDNENAN
jgi:hypothetical protein